MTDRRSRILQLTAGPDDWKKLLADPEKQWRTGHSARTLANCWEAAEELPPEAERTFRESDDPLLRDLQPVLAVPEFKVPLPGGGRASQNDLFVLARSAAGPVTIMVEGKVSESFGPRLADWLQDASAGKKTRLSFLIQTLGLSEWPSGDVRYQLLHRAASAILTGEQYRAAAAVLIVHSFSRERAGWADYQAFTRLFGVEAVEGTIQRLNPVSHPPLFGVWVVGDPRFLKS